MYYAIVLTPENRSILQAAEAAAIHLYQSRFHDRYMKLARFFEHLKNKGKISFEKGNQFRDEFKDVDLMNDIFSRLRLIQPKPKKQIPLFKTVLEKAHRQRNPKGITQDSISPSQVPKPAL